MIKQCLVCGKEFVREKYGQVYYCSTECRKKAALKRNNARLCQLNAEQMHTRQMILATEILDRAGVKNPELAEQLVKQYYFRKRG